MEYAKFLYATTYLSINKIAKLMTKRYKTVRDELYNSFSDEFVKARQAACYAQSKWRDKNPQYGKQSPNHKGACEDGKGYLTIYKPKWYTGRKKSERVFLHHVIWCKAMNITEIPKGYIVHHIDHDKQNNNLNNLALMTMGAHARLHSREGSTTIPKGSRSQVRPKRIARVVEGHGWNKTIQDLVARDDIV